MNSVTQEISYREVTNFDLGEILEIERSCYQIDPWSIGQFKEELAQIPRSRYYLVACSENKVIGYGGIAITQDVADIHTLTVASEFRARGIGKTLLEKLEAWAIKRGATKLMLEMRVGNIEAQPLYEKAGYSVISLRKNYYGNGVDAHVMSKSI